MGCHQPIGLFRQISRIKCEIAAKETVFPKMIAGGRIPPILAETTLWELRAVLKTLEATENAKY